MVQGLLKVISNVYPLSLVLASSFTVDFTIMVVLVPCKFTSLVEIVTERSEAEIQARLERTGVNDSVSVWLQPAYYVQGSILKL